jgi:branched-chain amino acid aminotransferase
MKNIGDSWPEGVGIFETIRVEEKKVFALHRHHCRAKESAEQLGFEIPSEDFVAKKSYEIIESSEFELARIRWHFSSDGEFSISYMPYKDPKDPAKLTIFEQFSDNYEVRTKSYPYPNLAILEQAKAKGYDDAIITTEDGQVAETSIATLLLKIENEWITSPLSSGILNGIVRALVLEAGLAKVKRVDLEELNGVQSALLLTSLRNAQHVSEISGRSLNLDNEMCARIHQLMNSFKGL